MIAARRMSSPDPDDGPRPLAVALAEVAGRLECEVSPREFRRLREHHPEMVDRMMASGRLTIDRSRPPADPAVRIYCPGDDSTTPEGAGTLSPPKEAGQRGGSLWPAEFCPGRVSLTPGTDETLSGEGPVPCSA